MGATQQKMKKRFVSFGCSMTWGHELGDNVLNVDGCVDLTIPSLRSYAALLAAHYGMEYVCKAVCGGSNDQILRLLIEYLKTEDYSQDFISIGWTSPSRSEYLINGTYRSLSINAASQNVGDALKMQEAHNFIMNQYSDSDIAQRYYNQVFAAEALLASYNIPNFMVNTLYFPGCGDVVAKNMILKETNFGSYVFSKYPIGPGHHPLEAGHRAWADAIISVLGNL
jgi:hypothetical protein